MGRTPGCSTRTPVGLSSSAPSSSVSTSSTPPTCTRTARARRSSAAPCGTSRDARKSSSRPRSTAGWATAPTARGLSRKHILAEIDDSLRRLGTDYVDLYQIHRWDPTTPIEETLEALHDVVKAGKARYIGASSMCAWQFAKALYTADLRGWTRFVSMQNHYNLLYREEEREMLPLCADQGVGVMPVEPAGARPAARRRLGRGDRAGRAPTSSATTLYAEERLADRGDARCAMSPSAGRGTRPGGAGVAAAQARS